MPPQTPQLRQISSTQGQTTFPLSQNQAITIGRDTTCQIVLDSAQYQGVSRRHAEIRSAGGGFEINDLGSSNGTFVNGQRLQQPRSLHPGDTIQLGQAGVQFVFEAPLSQAPSPLLGATMVEGQMPGYPPPATPSYPPATPSYPPATPAYGAGYPQQPVYGQTPPALVNQQAPAKSNNTGKWIGAGVAIVLAFAGLNARSLFRNSAPAARQPTTTQPTAARPTTPASDQPAPTEQPSDQPAPASQPTSNTKQVDVAALERSFKLTTEPKEERNRKVTTNSKNFTADILVFEIEAKSSFDPRQSWFGARFLDANGKEVGDPSLLYVENPPNQWSSGDRRSVFLVLPSDRSSLRTVQLIPFTRRN